MTNNENKALLTHSEHRDLEDAPSIYVEKPFTVQTEVVELLHLAYPIVVAFVMEFLPGFLGVALVGHLDSPLTKEFVDAAALSTVFLNLSSLSVGFGLASAMDTLCSQAVGAGKTHMLGVYLQCGILVLGLTYIPMFLMNYHTAYFLRLFGQDPTVAALAGDFSRVTVFCLPLCFLYELLKKVLQAQQNVAPMAYIAMFSNVVYATVGYYLCYHTSFGFIGVAYARLACVASMVLMAGLYMVRNPIYKTWWLQGATWSSQWFEAVAHVPEFLRFGVPAMVMMLLEWWALEILTLMSGWTPLPVLAISVHSVLVTLSSVAFSIFLGISIATTIRVGTALGAYEPQRAKMIAFASYIVMLGSAAVLGSFVLATHNVLPAWFINDPASIAETQGALYVLVIYQLMDAMKMAAQGLLRGMGRQAIGANVNAVAYCVVGLPMAALVGLHCGFDVPGLWTGMTVGVAMAFVIFTGLLLRTDWRAMADAAADRTSK
ncbi:Multidrug/Oligosaccharidyl-lipid/Polysaccharide (MOP) Flippase Superfamily [Achlya hypogyna]|uniref:Multidrug/Oligosaccharidyl-lipid/Polysaccharide (MOP) Flippase Superfamily n=1 Tax=Achlya hypogyna TaxID=1202772 RepID=A0A1V9ZIG5_ACHHY|nr:Multidrug/Oligosaccharidyl-lipid/Polysaccharide (MOP) Flippase Superfamily [Achlya hypogyna]